ncbi:LacI family DNA-binding transcriptional regulator [Photobacterium sp. ZSDE20]|uniref:LacI family DNA-binding transcriptional regulator n=1 Tax=Photobacterium pectinilyticum TaxID=2906793 RepID=A0ABT1N6D4_9GAMM|nr:LacI family DNA-binding transcriptional regulator [Photobacterium sp. ZSDE20]MCQ1060307.1 LacI family DNA-binding transcriptional regulator [Photobacterium sp. ZSDE20]MDD1827605.1 LacI family DNA-binding transcriptional regulator [Photobacterium sp. ZSDE20]
MRQGKITSIDVARLLGVSQSTVSRAFNPNASISDKKRKLVIDGAQKLGYTPNAMARGLTSKRSGLVAIVSDNEVNPIYDEIIRKLSYTIQAQGGQPVLCMADNNNMNTAVNKAIEYQVDGLIIATSKISKGLLEKCLSHGIQLTFINQYLEDTEASSFCTDNRLTGKQIADYLVETGHQRTAYLAGNRGSMVNEQRWEGFRDRLLQHGAPPSLYIPGTFSFQSGVDAAATITQHYTDIEAVFCANDIIAIGLLEGMQKISKPQRPAVIGVDDIPMAAWPSFQLTSYRQPLDKLIEEAIAQLLNRIEMGSKADLQYHYYSGELIVRDTA